MRSYYSHLQAVQSIGEDILITQKPVFRSSAIFPVIHTQHYSSKVIFMGYWLLKRHIREIGLLYTLRDAQGVILSRKYLLVDSAKAYNIQLSEFENIPKHDFTGSLELEIFSTKDLVYPYPAFVLVYFGDHFSTAVHSVGRIYNDIEDLSKNEEYKVSESGFDIYGNENLSPFIAFTNGAMPNKTPEIKYEINNVAQQVEKGTFKFKSLKPFETVFLKLKEYIDLAKILGNNPGTIKIEHNLEGFFPRFAAGNFDESLQTISITHTYYDSSGLDDDKSFWNRKDDLLNDSSVSIPLYITNNQYTRVAIYPIFSPSDFSLSYTFYDEKGNCLKQLNNYHVIKSSNNKYEQVDFGVIARAEDVDVEKAKSVNLVCNWTEHTRIPTRIKFGLNIGIDGSSVTLPSNICFAPLLGNPAMLKKTGTFRWAPFINIGRSEIVLTNSSSLKDYTRTANIKLTFHREADDSTLNRTISIAPNAIHVFALESDDELSEFYNGKSGWLAAVSDNPFLNGYYFDFFENGSVGADHIF